MATDSATDFLTKYLIDHQAGGVFVSTDVSGTRVLADDKQLADQAASVTALAGNDSGTSGTDALDSAAAGLKQLRDTAHPGFVEISDRYFRPHGAGHVRTPRHQLEAVTAILTAAGPLAGTGLLDDCATVLPRVLATSHRGSFPTRTTRDWSRTIDPTPDLGATARAATAIALAIGLGISPEVGATDLVAVAERLREFTGAVTKSATSVPPTATFAQVFAESAIGLTAAGKALSDKGYLEAAQELLRVAVLRFRDPRYGGFWDRTDPLGVVRVEWADSYYRGDSPFPVKLAADAALLLRAAADLRAAGGIVPDEIEPAARAGLDDLTDRRHGGVFLGHGYFWSAPEDPTVPFFRRFWVNPTTPGSLAVGNLIYQPLQQKASFTQAMAALATVSSPVAASVHGGVDTDVRGAVGRLAPDALSVDVERIVIRAPENLPLDQPRYLAWLSRTQATPTSPFGLTTQTAPLGHRADRTWQVFSAHHAIADMRVLGVELDHRDVILDQLRRAQNPDGGFGEQPGHISDVFTSYCAVLALYMLGEAPADVSACREFLHRCQNPDGGYGDVPGLHSDIWHTNLAVISLHALGVDSRDPEGAAAFVLSCSTQDGGYGSRPGNPPDTFSVYRAISTLLFLGHALPDADKSIRWLQDCQVEDGAFLYRPGRVRSLVGTYHALAGLALLGSAPRDRDSCKRWIGSHQNPDGGFGPVGAPSVTTDEGFTCLQSAYILQGALSRYWIALIN